MYLVFNKASTVHIRVKRLFNNILIIVYMDASDPKWVNSKLKTIGVSLLWFGDLKLLIKPQDLFYLAKDIGII